MTRQLPSDVEASVASAARIVKSRYRGYAEYEDLVQECYLWLFDNAGKVTEWREKYSEKHAERVLVKALRNHCEKYARKEKAAYEGYQPEDEFFYSIPMVVDMLTLYFDPERFTVPSKALDEHTSGGRPASEGGNLMAMVADVGRAYEALPGHDKLLLYYVYGAGTPSTNISYLAEDWECSYSAANMRVRRVAGRLRAALGGPNPYHAEGDYEQ